MQLLERPTSLGTDDSRLFSDLSEPEQIEFVRKMWIDAEGIGSPRGPHEFNRVMGARQLSDLVHPSLWRPNAWAFVARFWSTRSTLLGLLAAIMVVLTGLTNPLTLPAGIMIASFLLLSATSIVLDYSSRLRRTIDDQPDLAAWGVAVQKALEREAGK